MSVCVYLQGTESAQHALSRGPLQILFMLRCMHLCVLCSVCVCVHTVCPGVDVHVCYVCPFVSTDRCVCTFESTYGCVCVCVCVYPLKDCLFSLFLFGAEEEVWALLVLTCSPSTLTG